MKKLLSGLLVFYIIYFLVYYNGIAILLFDRDFMMASGIILFFILFFGVYIYSVFSTRWEDKRFFNKTITIFIFFHIAIIEFQMEFYGVIFALMVLGVIKLFLWNRSKRFHQIVNAIILMTYLGLTFILMFMGAVVFTEEYNDKIIRYGNNEIIIKERIFAGDKITIIYERVFLGVYKAKDKVYDYNYKDTD